MNAKKILGYALGPVGSAAFGLLSLPLISWYFPAEDIGRIVLLQTIAGLSILLLGLGLDQSYIRDYYAVKDKAALFKSVFLSPLILTVAVVVLVLLINASWPSEIIFDIPSANLGILFLIFLATTLIIRFLALILRMKEQALAFSVSQLAPKFLILVLVFAVIASGLPANTTSLVFAYTAAQVLTVALLIYQLRRDLQAVSHAKWSPELHRDGLRYGLPLAFGNLAYWGLTSIDRFVLKNISGLDELGIYSMAVSFGAVALIFQSVFSTIWAPLVFKWVEEKTNLDKIGDITLSMTVLISAMICLIGIFSPMATWILPEKYTQVQFILLSCMLFPLFYTLTEVSGIGLNVVRSTWLITVINIVAFIANTALLYLLVPKFGAKGAAMASATAFWLFFIFKTEFSSRLWQPLPRLKIYTNSTLCLMICLAYTWLGTRDNYIWFALAWAVGLGFLFLKYKHALFAATEKIKAKLNRSAK